jgi:uncharacterized protein with FMN-binding domain
MTKEKHMRKAAAVVVGATALTLPNVNAWAASQKTTAKTKVVTATKSFTGYAANADRWGEVEVTIVVKKTTTTNLTTKKRTVKRRILSVKVPVYPNHTDRSVFINQNALPTLIQETISAQSARINLVSNATDTSQAFDLSLQSAILKAKAW